MNDDWLFVGGRDVIIGCGVFNFQCDDWSQSVIFEMRQVIGHFVNTLVWDWSIDCVLGEDWLIFCRRQSVISYLFGISTRMIVILFTSSVLDYQFH